jgi:hypothetical protein
MRIGHSQNLPPKPAEIAVIEAPTGARQTYRRPAAGLGQAVLVWELFGT